MNPTLRAIRLLFLTLLLAACASCASSKRMTRISPFGEMPAQAELDRDRVNAWPLVYHQRGSSSILWPIVDIDERGFAVRPLLNKEDHDWSVLFPLSSYNTKRKVGWLLTAYKYEDYAGIFPLFHHGDDFHSIGPFWKGDDDWESYGAFPLAGKFDDLVHLGPLWWERDAEGLEEGGLFPFIYAGENLDRVWFWPLYSHEFNKDKRRRSFLLSLASFEKETDGDFKTMLHPFWYNLINGEERTRALLPLYYDYSDPNRSLWLTPLYGQGTKSNGERYLTSVLGPLYVDYSEDGRRDVYMAALAHWGSESDGSMWRLWPLASYASGPVDPDFLYHLTLGGYRKSANRTEWNITPLVHYEKGSNFTSWGIEPLIGGRKSPNHRRLSLLWSLLYQHNIHSKEGEVTSHRWNVTPLIGYKRYQDKLSWRATPLVSVKRHPDEHQLSLLWSLLYKHRSLYEEGEHKRTRASGLLGAVRHEWDTEYTRTSVLKYLYRRERRGEKIARDIFPFVSWDSDPDGGKLSLLWRLFSLERTGEKRGGHVLFVPWGDRSTR